MKPVISVYYTGGNSTVRRHQSIELNLAAVAYIRSMLPSAKRTRQNTCLEFKADNEPFKAGHVIWLKETLAEIRTKALAAGIPLGLVPIDMAYENAALNPKAWSPEIAAVREKWEKLEYINGRREDIE